MIKYAIISKNSSGVVYLKSGQAVNDSRFYEWTNSIYDAETFAGGDEDRNGKCIACWSAGIPASLIAVECNIRVVDHERLGRWEKWDLPVPAYEDSPSGCQRMVICGPGE